MRYTKTERAAGLIVIFILFWVALFIVLSATQVQHRDGDIFWALRTGRWIMENWKVPFTDPFSYTFGGREWVDFTWGFQVIAHSFYTYLGGWTGLCVLQVLISFAIFGALFLNLRGISGGRSWLLALLMVLVLAGAISRLFIRPHLFGFFFISLYLLLLNTDERRSPFLPLFLILPAQVLWVNIHSSAILGLFIVWGYASGEFVDTFLRVGFKGFPEVVKRRKRLMLLAVVLPFVTLLNPYGLKLAIFPFIHQSGLNADALRHIGEWTREPLKALLLYFYPLPINYFAFRLLFYLSIVSMALNWRRLKTRDIMLIGGAAYMALSHARWIGQFAFFAAPVAALNLFSYLEARQREPLPLKWAGLGLALFVSLFLGLMLRDTAYRNNIGIGVPARNFPIGTVRFMKENNLKGNIYNTYMYGGYLIFEYPELKVFIDGRTPTVYSPHFFWKTRQVIKKKGWEKVASEYGITMALVQPDRSICKVLYEEPDWVPVVFDDASVLYLKKGGGYDEIINGHGLSFKPCTVDEKADMPEGGKALRRMKKEIELNLRSIGDGEGGVVFSRPHRLLGLVVGKMKGEEGHLEMAVEELQKAVMVVEDGFVYHDLGLALGKVKRYDEAIEAFRTSIGLNPGFERSYLALGLTYFDKEDYENAARWLGRYTLIADDRAEFLGLKTLGVSLFRLGDLAGAEDALKRAAFLADKSKERAEVFYELGNTLFEAGRLAEGKRYYSRALDDNSSYRKVYENLYKMLEHKKKSRKAAAIRQVLQKHAKKD
jgi:tetratricopeptide (TPR) repeat protein